jgi:serine/threonine protein kinase
MSQTNEEFFKQGNCMYFTDEVVLKTVGDARFVNEF